jgi:peptidoglycan-associated lipoprotein
MKTMSLWCVIATGLVVLLSACTTTDSVVTDSQSQPDQSGGAYDTRGVSDTYGYNPDGTPISGQPSGGQIVGGPSAGQASRIVYFDFDSAQVRADSRPIVQAHANYLVANPGALAYLEGHADESGTREYNVGLGDRRNSTVRQLMIAMGVSPQQIQTISYGEERPVATGRDDASYDQNRRVEIAY